MMWGAGGSLPRHAAAAGEHVSTRGQARGVAGVAYHAAPQTQHVAVRGWGGHNTVVPPTLSLGEARHVVWPAWHTMPRRKHPTCRQRVGRPTPYHGAPPTLSLPGLDPAGGGGRAYHARLPQPLRQCTAQQRRRMRRVTPYAEPSCARALRRSELTASPCPPPPHGGDVNQTR